MEIIGNWGFWAIVIIALAATYGSYKAWRWDQQHYEDQKIPSLLEQCFNKIKDPELAFAHFKKYHSKSYFEKVSFSILPEVEILVTINGRDYLFIPTQADSENEWSYKVPSRERPY